MPSKRCKHAFFEDPIQEEIGIFDSKVDQVDNYQADGWVYISELSEDEVADTKENVDKYVDKRSKLWKST